MHPQLKIMRQFVDVPYQIWESCQNVIQEKKFTSKEIIIREGQTFNKMFFLKRGIARFFTIKDGIEITTNVFFKDSFPIDFHAYITEEPTKYFFEALTDCEITILPKSFIIETYEKNQLMQKFGRLIAEKSFVQLSERINSLFNLTPEERYLELLENKPHYFKKLPQYIIASYLGVKPESLSRIKKRLHTKR